ncbi:Cu(I)-responsive transcriptional regulator [Microvirga mediterraneensis]|uniref:Cu(I)-responsive transcriptional regulator n=1 Tax=Microvirga mediterraneensis TaxID=2754695 RepID=A0A838BUQ0_9HYPH|nr:Cu(I)-responsive transcriptional regulator [Microvirga mediterraneensis]MBA1158779.1 Cu(I)-responsive transcriptional regulator [Microvirga mediterraneensis]
MNIGQAAESSGVSAKMIRYYESIGLIAKTARTAAGYRVYSNNDVNTLGFIRRARDLGFSVEQITELVSLWRDRQRASTDVKRIALEHVALLETKARELQEMASTLRHLAKSCHGNERPDCPIIEGLADSNGLHAVNPRLKPRFGTTGLQSANRAKTAI